MCEHESGESGQRSVNLIEKLKEAKVGVGCIDGDHRIIANTHEKVGKGIDGVSDTLRRMDKRRGM
jgi:hypothetical protein